MVWQDPKEPNAKLRMKLLPWPHTGLVIKLSLVLVGMMFALGLFGTVASLLTGAPTADTFVLGLATGGFGLVFGLYALIARLFRRWTKL